MQLVCAAGHPLFSVDKRVFSNVDIGGLKLACLYSCSYGDRSRPKHDFECSATAQDMEGLVQLVHSGAYLAYMPINCCQSQIEAGAIKVINSDQFGYRLKFYIVRRRHGPKSDANQAFFQTLLNSFVQRQPQSDT